MTARRKAAINRRLVPVWALALVLSVISGVFFADAYSAATDDVAVADGTAVPASGDVTTGDDDDDDGYPSYPTPPPYTPYRPNAEIDIEKYVSISGGPWEDADEITGPIAYVGYDEVAFRFVVTNTGDIALTNIQLSDSDFPTDSCPLTDPLAPGESFECVIGPFDAQEGQHMDEGYTYGEARAGAECVVIIDEEMIDNGIYSIEQAAWGHGVEPDYLVNDDRPTEWGNPWLRWNTEFPGDIVLLPSGQILSLIHI